MDEILVKGQDGKWYILKGEEMVPYGETTEIVAQKSQNVNVPSVTLPKGVSQQVYDRLEIAKPQKIATPTAQTSLVVAVSPPSAVPVSHAEHPLRVELEELIDGVVHEVMETRKQGNSETSWDLILQKRFRTIVSSRLRDVRDVNEIKEMLTRPQKVGGMGLLEVSGVIEIIEKAFKEFQAKWKAEEEKKRIALRQKQAQERAGREEQKAKQEQEGLEERYRKMVGEKGGGGRGEGHADSLRLPGPASLQSPRSDSSPVAAAKGSGGSLSSPLGQARTRILAHSTPPTSSEGKKIMDSASAALLPQVTAGKQPPTPSLPSAPVVTFPKEKEKKEEKPKPVVILPKSPPPIKSIPKPALPIAGPSGKVTDIRPAPKLVGPVEEIGSLRLEDFRRLPGQTAQERAQKIMEKIELLGQESLVRRSQGLEAWRNCPLNQLYGQILGAALQNRTSPQTVLTEWATAGKTSLTLDEFRAIMELNQKLRF